MSNDVRPRRILALVCVGFAVLALWVLRLELSPYALPDGDRERFIRLSSPDALTVGLSTDAIHASLNECWWGLTDPYATLQPQTASDAVASNCAASTAALLDRYPTFSYGWLVLAVAREHLQEWSGMAAALQQSRRASPSDEQSARLRVALTERRISQLPGSAVSSEKGDLQLLLRSYSSLTSIVTRYLRDAAFRARVTDALEEVSASDKQRFVQALERAMN